MSTYVLNHVLVGATGALGGCQNVSLPLGIDVDRSGADGSIYARDQTIRTRRPVASFTTRGLETVLGLVPLTGKSLADLTGGLVFYGCKMQSLGVGVAAGSVHRSYAMGDGLLVPTSLSCAQGGDAMMSFEATVIDDGTNPPVDIETAAALPTAVDDDERFGLGSFTIESIATGTLTNLSIDFGITVEPKVFGGDIWPTDAVVLSVRPTVSLTVEDLTLLDAAKYAIGGLAVTHASTTCYLRKRTRTSYELDAATEHIKLSFAGLAIVENAIDAAQDDSASMSISIPLEYDGSNAPLTITTGQAIT